jgi:hypothetical protein
MVESRGQPAVNAVSKKIRASEEMVLGILREHKFPMTRKQIFDICQKNGAYQNFSIAQGCNQISGILRDLHDRGFVRKAGVDGSGATLWEPVRENEETPVQMSGNPTLKEEAMSTTQEKPKPIMSEVSRKLEELKSKLKPAAIQDFDIKIKTLTVLSEVMDDSISYYLDDIVNDLTRIGGAA